MIPEETPERLSLQQVVEALPIEKLKQSSGIRIKVYKRRWFILILFMLFAAANNMQWIQYTIISNVIQEYYGVSSMAVESTSMLFMVAYIVLLFPACYLMNSVGLRWTCLIGSMGTCIGSWIKVFSVSPDRFIVAFVGQALVAGCQVLVMATPSRLAAIWFDSGQVASATAIGCLGCQIGIGTVFLIGPMLVRSHKDINDTGRELSTFFWGVAIFCTAVTLAIFTYFPDEPDMPPSETRALQKDHRKAGQQDFWQTLKRILTNRSFLMLWNSYGINVGTLNTISTMLNPMVCAYFENAEEDAGRIGFLSVIMGTAGSPLFGVILDKTKKFKELTIFLYILTLVGEIMFAVALVMRVKWMVVVGAIVFGIFSVSYSTVGYEVCAEITYPEPEEVSTGILNMSNQIYGMLLVLIVDRVMAAYGHMVGHMCLCIFLTLGIVLTTVTKDEHRREVARKNAQYSTVSQLSK